MVVEAVTEAEAGAKVREDTVVVVAAVAVEEEASGNFKGFSMFDQIKKLGSVNCRRMMEF